MSSLNALPSLRGALAALALAASGPGLLAQSAINQDGGEYNVVFSLKGDQVAPHASFSGAGGYVVWHDNNTDGDGLGVSARRLLPSLGGARGVFRVNSEGSGDQQNAKVAVLSNGGAAFVWQGGAQGAQKVYARFIGADGTFATADVKASSHSENNEIQPSVVGLPDGNSVVVWSSFNQDGSMQGVFGQRFSASGAKLGAEFQVNQFTKYNQRNAAVAANSAGQFVVVWISEGQRAFDNVDVYARVYSPSGVALGNEFRISSTEDYCGTPDVAMGSDGVFQAVWAQLPSAVHRGGWNIFGASFRADGTPVTSSIQINTDTSHRHSFPKIASSGQKQLVVWTSLGQDGSMEGVYGRALTRTGHPEGTEFRVNTTTVNKQRQPAVAADETGRFLVSWSGFTGVANGFDLFGQRYILDGTAGAMSKPEPPFVSALSQNRLSVSWPALDGFDVAKYSLYIDDQADPAVVTGNYVAITELAPSSSHTFRVAYTLKDGRQSALSEPTTGVTWGADINGDGLPDDWQTGYWGSSSNWPLPDADSDGDGVSNYNEYLAGTNPLDAGSVLKAGLISTAQGWRLSWNTQPGLIYQIQATTDFRSWSDAGTPRFAAGSNDSIPVSGGQNSVYYRVIRVR